jgi:redox-sensitive bicupin YhaK (pirin superfamily)
MSTASVLADQAVRRIVKRSRGDRSGAVTRLMEPWIDRQASPLSVSELADMLKPFLFLDLFESDAGSTTTHLHPHSGLATLTYLWEGAVRFEDTSGATGMLPTGGVEWLVAGGGAWHGGGLGDAGRSRGFQLWVALPPERELGPVESVYLAPDEVASKASVAVLLGEYGGARSPLACPSPMTYLAVRLKAGESWRYQPPAGQTICWVALASGGLQTPEAIEAREMVVFEPSTDAIEFTATGDTEFVLGSGIPQAQDLALGRYSVHTNPDALRAGEARIEEIRARLAAAGRL